MFPLRETSDKKEQLREVGTRTRVTSLLAQDVLFRRVRNKGRPTFN